MYICRPPTAAAHGCKPRLQHQCRQHGPASLTTAAKARCKILEIFDDFWMFIKHSLWVLTHTLRLQSGLLVSLSMAPNVHIVEP